jgi:phage shock protein E
MGEALDFGDTAGSVAGGSSMNALRQIRIQVSPWVSLWMVSICVACSSGGVSSVNVSEVETLRSAAAPPMVLDVRSEAEYRAGHIAGAIHVPHDELAARMGEIAVPEGGVIVYCQKGPRARKAEQVLLEHGVARVMHLEDGFSAWEAAGLPVQR